MGDEIAKMINIITQNKVVQYGYAKNIIEVSAEYK